MLHQLSSNPVLLKIILITHPSPTTGNTAEIVFQSGVGGYGKHILAGNGRKGSEVCKNHHPFHSCANSCPTFLPDTPPSFSSAAMAGQDLTITKLPNKHNGFWHKGTSCAAPNPPRQGTNSGEGKTGCVMLGMNPISMLSQPWPLSKEGGRSQSRGQQQPAPILDARGLSSQHLSCTFSSWGGLETSSSWHRRHVHGLFTQNSWACLLKFQIPKDLL